MATAHTDPAPYGPMTYARFLEWLDEDTLAEWVDGTVVMTSPASARHQLLVAFLADVLARFIEVAHVGGTVLTGPFQMKLANAGREPDVLFLARAHKRRLRQTHLNGPADLVIEVISPESVKRDREQKFSEYQQAGIPEYWLIDPADQHADFFQLDAQGIYQRVAPDAQGIYQAPTILGFWLNIAWLWQEPLPAVDEALLDIMGQTYANYLREQMRRRGL
jgi:Uma2 family endonuclease